MNIHLNFDVFKKEALDFELSVDNSYSISYIEFVNYFENIKGEIKEHHLIISSHFVYAWMPTIINLNLQDIDKTLALLNKAKSDTILDNEEIQYLIVTINNSLIGLSKLLHFINPSKYAIWDSRIFRFVTGKKSTYGINNPKTYKSYLSIIDSIATNKGYPELHKKIKGNYNYEISPMRAIEVVVFEADRKRQQNIKAKSK